MVKKGYLLLLLIAVLLLPGCTVRAEAPVGLHVVTRVDILYRQRQEQLERHYTTPSKMETVLNYLRLLEYAGMPDKDPELCDADHFRIDVQLDDGARHVYYLYADRFLSKDFRPWEQVKPDHSLLSILKLLPDDL